MLTLVPQLADSIVVADLSPVQFVTVLVGLVAPILVGLVTRASTSAGTKATILAGISVLVGVGQGFIDLPAGQVWNWQVALFNALIAWVTAVATYFGYYKPAGVSAWAQSKMVKDKAA